MFYKHLKIVALLLCLTGVAGLASAQEAPTNAGDACTVTTGQSQPPNYNGYPYDHPEDAGGVNNTPDEPPAPVNPVRKVCDNKQVEILMGNSRHFGYRIGDRIDVTILIKVSGNVQVDFNSLTRQGTLSFEGSDFELADVPVVRSQPAEDGKTLHRVDLVLQTWVFKPYAVFNLDLRYATELAADGATPVWKILTTPDFVVSRSQTVDHGSELLEGDLDMKAAKRPWPTLPLLVTGMFLVLLFPGIWVVKWINRVRPRRKVPADRAAWRIFDREFKDARAKGWKSRNYENVVAALRRYLDQVKDVHIESATILEIRDRLHDDPDLDTIDRVISLCNRAIYKGDKLDDEENRLIVEGIEALVPRPWDSK